MSSRRQKINPVTEKAFSQQDFLGISQRMARVDHTHGTPINPTDTHKGETDPHEQYRLESENHSHKASGIPGRQLDHGNAMVAASLLDDDHTQYVLVDLSRMATGEYRHVGNVADDATFNLPVVANGGMGLMIAGADEERAQFSIKSDGTVNLIMASANVVANADTDAKVCIGTSVASPCVIKNRLGGAKAILLQLWYN